MQGAFRVFLALRECPGEWGRLAALPITTLPHLGQWQNDLGLLRTNTEPDRGPPRRGHAPSEAQATTAMGCVCRRQWV